MDKRRRFHAKINGLNKMDPQNGQMLVKSSRDAMLSRFENAGIMYLTLT